MRTLHDGYAPRHRRLPRDHRATLVAISQSLDELEGLVDQLPPWDPAKTIMSCFLRNIPSGYRRAREPDLDVAGMWPRSAQACQLASAVSNPTMSGSNADRAS